MRSVGLPSTSAMYGLKSPIESSWWIWLFSGIGALSIFSSLPVDSIVTIRRTKSTQIWVATRTCLRRPFFAFVMVNVNAEIQLNRQTFFFKTFFFEEHRSTSNAKTGAPWKTSTAKGYREWNAISHAWSRHSFLRPPRRATSFFFAILRSRQSIWRPQRFLPFSVQRNSLRRRGTDRSSGIARQVVAAGPFGRVAAVTSRVTRSHAESVGRAINALPRFFLAATRLWPTKSRTDVNTLVPVCTISRRTSGLLFSFRRDFVNGNAKLALLHAIACKL